MPLYMVRWSHEHVSVVYADDEDELSSTLGERGDLDGVVWDVYSGPLWFDFDLHGAPAARMADESHRATLRAAERFATSPPVSCENDGSVLDWADAAGLLEMLREQWIDSLELGELREALRCALHRLDVADAARSN